MWSVRENLNNNQNETELFHYGVKGMKWGIRKDDEKVAKKERKKQYKEKIKQNKKSAQELGINYNDYADSLYAKDERLGKGYSAANGLLTLLKNGQTDKRLGQFITDVRNGSSATDPNLNDVLQKYRDTKGANYSFAESSDRIRELTKKAYVNETWTLSKSEWAELEQLTEEAEALIDYYGTTYSNIPTEEELTEMEENEKAIESLRASLKKSLALSGITLKPGQSVSIGFDSNGDPVYKYTDNSGKITEFGNIDGMINAAKKDQDFRNRSSSQRTREKNVDPNAKPVSIKKGEKIETGEKEREEKKLNSPGAAKTISQLEDIIKSSSANKLNPNVKRNKQILEANLTRNNKSLSRTKLKSNIVPKSTIEKAKSSVKKYANEVSSFLKNKADGRNFIEKILNIEKKSTSSSTKEKDNRNFVEKLFNVRPKKK